MAQTHLNNTVLVGNGFPIELFDERKIFDGNLDHGSQVKLGQFAQYNYLSGTSSLTVTPDRVDIRSHTSDDIIPDVLVEATTTIFKMIEPVRDALQVTGFGMNCDSVFNQQRTDINGTQFCSQLINQNFINLVAKPNLVGMGRIQFRENKMSYTVRIEPDSQSHGANLYVAVNGHQEVSKDDLLASKLKQVNNFRSYVQKLHNRIVKKMRGV